MCSFFQHIFLVESFSIPGIVLGSRGKTINKVTILKEYKFLKVEMIEDFENQKISFVNFKLPAW